MLIQKEKELKLGNFPEEREKIRAENDILREKIKELREGNQTIKNKSEELEKMRNEFTDSIKKLLAETRRLF